ncbi:MAG: Sodium/hydrogen exchanger-family protein [Chlamydiales bacterium]|jgi:CPA2 family monovalent cation:H+ antiporter-2|nr:Sodium/hydrogen exchanger-family protein [Chlamydiales bacterium]
MDNSPHHLEIVLILTMGFGLASVFGYLAQRFKLSPIFGYLFAGYIIGPYSPGFVASLEISEQLAEVGVILMMFGVGMHFKWEDLARVNRISIPGALGQTALTCLITCLLLFAYGWTIKAGIIIGIAIGVASTVVLVRVLNDNHLLNTPTGHIAVGWLIVEDLLTVIAFAFLPSFATYSGTQEISNQEIALSLAWILAKFLLLGLFMMQLGGRLVAGFLYRIAKLRSSELLTLATLAIIFAIATGSALIFGTSMALGAFLAGMAIGRTDVQEQASANALPLQDAFSTLFFIAVGMLFDPLSIGKHPGLFLIILSIVVLFKPLFAFLIVKALKYPVKMALTIALSLAQIGEFSFILAEEGMRLKLLPDEGYDIIIACALISICLNPLLFKALAYFEKGQKKEEEPNDELFLQSDKEQAIIVGAGPIGKMAAILLEKKGYQAVLIEQNIESVIQLKKQLQQAIYGDARNSQILQAAGIETARLLIITALEKEANLEIIRTARFHNPKINIVSRITYLQEKRELSEAQVNWICSEEETEKAFAARLEAL